MNFRPQYYKSYPGDILKQFEGKLTLQGLQNSHDIIMQLPAGIAVFSDREFIAKTANNAYLELIDRAREDFIGKSLFEAVSELKGQQAEKILHNLFITGKPYYGNDFKASLVRNGNTEDVYFDFVYQPLKNEKEEVNGVLVIAFEITSAVEAEQAAVESKRQFRQLVNQSPLAMAIFLGDELIIDTVNDLVLKNIWHRGLNEVQGMKLLDVFPELHNQPFPKLLKKVYGSGIALNEKEAVIYISTGKGELNKCFFNLEYSPIIDEDKRSVSGVVVTMVDVTSQVNVKKRLEENEFYLHRMADNMPVILFMSDKDGYFTYQNSQWYSYTGLSQKDSNGFGWLAAVHSEQREETEKTVKKAIAEGRAYNLEFKLRRKDGAFRWFVTSGKQNYDINGLPEGYLATLMDIHERKAANEILRESKESLNMAIATAALGTWDYDPVTDLLIWDERTKTLFGLPAGEGVSFELFLKGIHEDDRDNVIRAINKAKEGENNGEYSVEYRIYRYADNQLRWIRAKAKVFFNEKKIPERFLGTVYDITEQKESVQKIEDAENRVRLATDGTGTGTWDLDLKTASIIYSPRLAEIFGHPGSNQLTHVQLRAQVHPDDVHAIVEKAFDEAMKTSRYYYEARIIWPDQSIHWVRTNGKVIFNETSEPVRMLGMMQDITIEKTALIALQQSETRYRQLVYSLPVPFYTTDGDGYIQIYNDAALELWGRKPDKADRWCGSLKIFKIDGTPLNIDECPMAVTLKTGKIISGQEIIIERPDGTRLNVLPHPHPVFNSKGEITGGINMLVNISERKIAEGNTSRLAAIIQSSDDAIISKTLKGIVTSWNTGAERLFGYTAGEMVGQPISILIPGDRMQEEVDILKRIAAGELITHFDTIRLTKSGKPVDISLTISPIKDFNGNIIGASKIARDITIQRNLYKILHENEQRLQMVIKAAELGTWEFQVSTREISCNKRYLEIAGLDENEQPTEEKMYSRVYAPDLPVMRQAIDAAKETGLLDMEIRYLHADNTLHWAQIRGKIVYDEMNVAEKVIGTALDITLQKNAYEAMRESELLFKTIANVSPVGLWMTDKEAKNNFVNGTWIDWTGLPLEQQYDGGWMSRVLPEDAIRTRKNFEKAMAVHGNFSDEFRLHRKDGEVRWCYTEGFPYYNNKGEFEGYAGSVTDITDRKMIEAELEKKVIERTQELNHSNSALEKSNSELEQFAYVASHDLQEPLRKVKTFVSRLQESTEEKNDSQRKVYMEKIVSAAGRMSDLIRDLLEYSRTAKIVEKLSFTDLNVILDNVKNDFELLIQQKKAIIQADNLPSIYAIPHQMTQLFTNLISNSLKFAKEEVSPVIRISSVELTNERIEKLALPPGKRYIEMVFADNGIGFNNEFSEKVFDIFQRLNPRTAYAGSGIGLSICRKIVSNHLGLIFAQSAETVGTSFYVILPCEDQPGPGDHAASTKPVSPEKQ